jgi:O-antigen ligase
MLGIAIAPDERPALLAGGVLAAVVIAVALAGAYRRQPWLLPLLALACVPARVGIHVGSAGSKLLVPLYVVIGGAAAALAWGLARDEHPARELGLAAWPLAAFLAWTGLSLAWSQDVHAGAIELLAFYLPFTILALCLARLPWRRLGVRLLYVEVTLMALAFAALGLYQYDTREIFQNPKVIVSNAYAPFFRVNSVFWDPSVYGRFLVLAIVASVVVTMLSRSPAPALAAAAIVVCWIGLLISFSQSSFAALLVAVAVAAYVAWRWRSLVAIGLAALVILGIGLVQPQTRRSLEHHTRSGLNHATSGRADLVANGIRIAASHPVVGVGVGGFEHAYGKRVGLKGAALKKAASHDTPVTVAAESGFVGLALFAWLLAVLARQVFGRLDRGPRRGLALAAGLGLTAVFVHSLFYNFFFEDPMTWGLVGLLALASPPAPPDVEAAVAPVPEQEAVAA